VSGLLDQLANADVTARDKARDALIAPLRLELDRLRHMLRPERVTAQSVPPELARDWVAPDDRALVEVLPEGDPNDTATLRQFATAVLAVAPDASGTPVWLIGAQHTVLRAFIEAGVLAVLTIAIMLWITWRRAVDPRAADRRRHRHFGGHGVDRRVAEFCQRHLALPLLLGVGVAFKIYYIMPGEPAGPTCCSQP
jgi:uncharacterized protein